MLNIRLRIKYEVIKDQVTPNQRLEKILIMSKISLLDKLF